VGSIDLVTEANQDPAPDLMDVAPDAQYVFVGLRGPNPLTGNDKVAHNAKGTIPGVGVIHVDAGGKVGHYKGQAVITNKKDDKEAADTHGLAVRSKSVRRFRHGLPDACPEARAVCRAPLQRRPAGLIYTSVPFCLSVIHRDGERLPS
jgi:hypothetical protein